VPHKFECALLILIIVHVLERKKRSWDRYPMRSTKRGHVYVYVELAPCVHLGARCSYAYRGRTCGAAVNVGRG